MKKRKNAIHQNRNIDWDRFEIVGDYESEEYSVLDNSKPSGDDEYSKRFGTKPDAFDYMEEKSTESLSDMKPKKSGQKRYLDFNKADEGMEVEDYHGEVIGTISYKLSAKWDRREYLDEFESQGIMDEDELNKQAFHSPHAVFVKLYKEFRDSQTGSEELYIYGPNGVQAFRQTKISQVDKGKKLHGSLESKSNRKLKILHKLTEGKKFKFLKDGMFVGNDKPRRGNPIDNVTLKRVKKEIADIEGITNVEEDLIKDGKVLTFSTAGFDGDISGIYDEVRSVSGLDIENIEEVSDGNHVAYIKFDEPEENKSSSNKSGNIEYDKLFEFDSTSSEDFNHLIIRDKDIANKLVDAFNLTGGNYTRDGRYGTEYVFEISSKDGRNDRDTDQESKDLIKDELDFLNFNFVTDKTPKALRDIYSYYDIENDYDENDGEE